MASCFRCSSRKGWRVQVYVRGVRRMLWLGNVTKKQAQAVAAHLEAIRLARDTGTHIPAPETLWLREVAPRIAAQLAAWGLVEHRSQAAANLPTTVGPYVRAYIDGRHDLKPNTLSRLNQSYGKLVSLIGAGTSLAAVTPGDADRAARALRAAHRHSTSGKIIRDFRQFFTAAMRDQLITSNPFAGINTAQHHDTAREAYITPDATSKLLEAAPNAFWRALIALVRFGGVRVPSEPLNLQWTDIDVETRRLVIRTHKTRQRVIPLFPEIAPHLAELYAQAPEGAVFVFDRYRSTAAKTWRQQFESIIKAAGLEQWDKLWQNMRASCRTDLEARFPGFVVDAWLGHSAAVGRKHYTRVNAEHYAAACGVAGGVVGPTIPDVSRQLGKKEKAKKPTKQRISRPKRDA